MKRIVCAAMIVLLLLTCTCGTCFAKSLYDNAEIIEHPDGLISYCEAKESECTLEALNDWYYNYIRNTDYAWYMIRYSDSRSDKGVYGTKDGVEMTVSFAKNSKGWYVGSEGYAVWYLPSEEDGLILSIGC